VKPNIPVLRTKNILSLPRREQNVNSSSRADLQKNMENNTQVILKIKDIKLELDKIRSSALIFEVKWTE
jgi:hypothetical protein